MGSNIEKWGPLLKGHLERQKNLRDQRQVRVSSEALYKVDRERRGEMTRQEQWETVMQILGPLLNTWELIEGQVQFVMDRVDEQLNLGRHPDTITAEELTTMQAFAVDLVDL